MLAHIVGSTTFFLIVINTMVAATLGGLVVAWARGSTAAVVAGAVAAALVWFGVQLGVTRRLMGAELGDVRFPTAG
jgi:outer membrane lipoprotein SlyB